MTMWPKLWQNLRSTRETELAEQFPMHVVCAWIGNSQLVAAKHDLQVTDDHFVEAAEAKSQLQPAKSGCNASQDDQPGNEKTHAFAGDCDDSQEDAEPSDGRYRTRTTAGFQAESTDFGDSAARRAAQLDKLLVSLSDTERKQLADRLREG